MFKHNYAHSVYDTENFHTMSQVALVN